ncbi:pyruvyl transferase Pvg1 [Schizosaccharomyces cryophilus OY26]|uniref:Pyruvyl transferase Pvg1 n=1 Tax=Schizosaccharomyces cryophilus (strain OY26 / ATCC MYA-4695 / CBS 11777 / NBRC 106824 / NRRL Y48691) TaxID=653667 RepID=S9XHW2_SCHCR|nr:pyruvyl transferase Pvg1 [Schizosaccharomyces cryophilus OY26]EPY53266.1 pyruvyl transferase Pvg1 [Schizosaccharomyces cryophilus OY26]
MPVTINIRYKYLLLVTLATVSIGLFIYGLTRTDMQTIKNPASLSSPKIHESTSNRKSLFVKAPAKNSAQCESTISFQKNVLFTFYKHYFEGVKKVALIGFPDHPNKGDSAIYVAERKLLEALDIEIVYICSSESDYSASELKPIVQETSPEEFAFTFHGGGNFGDLYPDHQQLREIVIRDFPKGRFISFPQSIWYNDETVLQETAKLYGDHPQIQLAFRDRQSYQTGVNGFGKDNEIILTPDIVFFLGMLTDIREKTPITSDVLILARLDREGGQEHSSESLYHEGLSSANVTYSVEDWLNWDPEDVNKPGATFDIKGQSRFVSGAQFLASHKAVITDRLHAHILSTLMGVPHIVVEDSKMGKITNYHNTWLHGCTSDGVSVIVDSSDKAVKTLLEWKANQYI